MEGGESQEGGKGKERERDKKRKHRASEKEKEREREGERLRTREGEKVRKREEECLPQLNKCDKYQREIRHVMQITSSTQKPLRHIHTVHIYPTSSKCLKTKLFHLSSVPPPHLLRAVWHGCEEGVIVVGSLTELHRGVCDVGPRQGPGAANG